MRDGLVHPTAIIGDDVTLGSDVVVGPFAIIGGRVTIGDGCWIGAHTIIGAPPEIRGGAHPNDWVASTDHGVTIGARSVIREAVQIHAGTAAATRVGADCFLMNQSYVAHDCVLEDGVTLAAHVSLAGHVRIGRSANLGLSVAVHQRRVVGPFAMVGMSSTVTRDVPPFVTAYGVPARAMGINRVGMERAGFAAEDVTAVISGDGHRQVGLAAHYEWFRTAAS